MPTYCPRRNCEWNHRAYRAELMQQDCGVCLKAVVVLQLEGAEGLMRCEDYKVMEAKEFLGGGSADPGD